MTNNIKIRPEDLIIETYSPIPRPQWIAHNDHGIRITHIPTGISVSKHEDRCQHRNRAYAMQELSSLVEKVLNSEVLTKEGKQMTSIKELIGILEMKNPSEEIEFIVVSKQGHILAMHIDEYAKDIAKLLKIFKEKK